jgi:hypothetical protein
VNSCSATVWVAADENGEIVTVEDEWMARRFGGKV